MMSRAAHIIMALLSLGLLLACFRLSATFQDAAPPWGIALFWGCQALSLIAFVLNVLFAISTPRNHTRE